LTSTSRIEKSLNCVPIDTQKHVYTFWDYFRHAWDRNAGLRIDQLLLCPSIASRLVAADVDCYVRGWGKVSDHAPTRIRLNNASEDSKGHLHD
jgi:exodeoxyribonuclease-3